MGEAPADRQRCVLDDLVLLGLPVALRGLVEELHEARRDSIQADAGWVEFDDPRTRT